MVSVAHVARVEQRGCSWKGGGRCVCSSCSFHAVSSVAPPRKSRTLKQPFASLPTIFSGQEYKRLETLRQIKEADRRTEEMAARKEEMINQRRKAALEVGPGTPRVAWTLF